MLHLPRPPPHSASLLRPRGGVPAASLSARFQNALGLPRGQMNVNVNVLPGDW